MYQIRIVVVVKDIWLDETTIPAFLMNFLGW